MTATKLNIVLHRSYDESVSKAVAAKCRECPEAAAVVRALGVLLLDKKLQRLIAIQDPKAHEQALRALGVIK
jgi:hypothetical protein